MVLSLESQAIPAHVDPVGPFRIRVASPSVTVFNGAGMKSIE